MDTCKEEEVEQHSFLSDPNAGVLEFISPENAGFYAKMKCYSEDFVVNEIDSERNLVVLDNYETPEERGCESLAMASRKRKLKDGYIAPLRMSETVPLLELVTSEKLLLLEQLATSYKQNLVPDPKQLVDLGLVEDKQRRASLHAAVSKAHPVLMTTTYRLKQGECGMSVMTNPKYVKLLEVLSPEEAEQVITLVSCQSDPGASFKLANRPKDERTKLHIVLNALYGKSLSSKYVDGKYRYQSPAKVARLAEDGQQSLQSRTIQLDDNTEVPSESNTPLLDAEVELCQSSSSRVELSQSSSSRVELSQSSSSQAGIVLKLRKKNRSGFMEKGKEKKKAGFEMEGDIFTKFVMKKNCIESLHALLKMSEAVQCPLWNFRLQGKKDKVGITLQQVSVKNVHPQRLLAARPQLKNCGIDIGNFKYVKQHVNLGGHHGNHFNITLRDLKPNGGDQRQDLGAVVTSSLKTVEEKGFINYFGLQRFDRIMSTPRVGLAMLKNDLRQAVDLALIGCHSWNQEVQELIDQQCFREASELLPSHLVKERLILKSLHQYRGDPEYAYTQAIQSIPQDTRLFFVQSFCSVVWNHIASYRLREYGLKLVEGDLVMKGRRWWEGGEEGNHDWGSDRTWLHTASAGDVASGSYSLYDVVLPVLGTSIILPNNKVADRIKEMMALVGITLSSFRMQQLKLRCPGTYRSLIAHPRNLSWQLVNNTPLPAQVPRTVARSGWNSNPSASTPNPSASTPDPPAMVPRINEEKGSNTTTSSSPLSDSNNQEGPSLNIEFELGKSMYATMLMRELTKKNI